VWGAAPGEVSTRFLACASSSLLRILQGRVRKMARFIDSKLTAKSKRILPSESSYTGLVLASSFAARSLPKERISTQSDIIPHSITSYYNMQLVRPRPQVLPPYPLLTHAFEQVSKQVEHSINTCPTAFLLPHHATSRKVTSSCTASSLIEACTLKQIPIAGPASLPSPDPYGRAGPKASRTLDQYLPHSILLREHATSKKVITSRTAYPLY
jgi:hypothetical protein